MEKRKIENVLSELPEDVDLDGLIERLYLLDKIELAERQIAAGAGIPHEEAKKRLEPWLK
jgi:hypothetical protein